jgi:hypothetical protein
MSPGDARSPSSSPGPPRRPGTPVSTTGDTVWAGHPIRKRCRPTRTQLFRAGRPQAQDRSYLGGLCEGGPLMSLDGTLTALHVVKQD